MLKNRDLKTIVKKIDPGSKKKLISEVKRVENIKELREYINTRNENNSFTNTDKLLISFLDDNIKREVDFYSKIS